MLSYEISMFCDTFLLQKAAVQKSQKGGGAESMHFLKAAFETISEFRNIFFKAMAVGVIKIISTEVSYFTMLYELTKNECFLFCL